MQDFGGHGALQPPPRRKRPLLAVALALLGFPAFLVAFGTAPGCMGFEEPTLRAIAACPMAARALGLPVRRSWLGISMGNAETEDDDGSASWRFPVTGSLRSGVVRVVARKHGTWTLSSARLEVDGRIVEVVSCTTPGAMRAVSFDAQVGEVVGPAPLARGDACHLDVSPPRDDDDARCRVVLRCGARMLYGAGTTGYLSCGADAQGAISARDGATSGDDGDPMLDLRMSAGEAVVTDQGAGGTWTASLRFLPQR